MLFELHHDKTFC